MRKNPFVRAGGPFSRGNGESRSEAMRWLQCVVLVLGACMESPPPPVTQEEVEKFASFRPGQTLSEVIEKAGQPTTTHEHDMTGGLQGAAAGCEGATKLLVYSIRKNLKELVWLDKHDVVVCTSHYSIHY